jgi:hypothetical protein
MSEIDPRDFLEASDFPDGAVGDGRYHDQHGNPEPLSIKPMPGRCGDRVETFLQGGALITEEGRRQSAFIAACDMHARDFPQDKAQAKIIDRLTEGGENWQALTERELEDIPRQVVNAYQQPRLPAHREDESCFIKFGPRYTIDRAGQTTLRVTTKANGLTFVDTINPARSADRERYQRKASERLGDLELFEALSQELMRLASGETSIEDDEEEDDIPSELNRESEEDDSNNIRPDQFCAINGEAIAFGISTEERHRIDGEVFIGSNTYGRQWPGGGAFSLTSPEAVEVDGVAFYFNPKPAEPARAEQREGITTWSMEDKHQWLEGELKPVDVASLFAEIKQAIDRFIEFAPGMDDGHKQLMAVFCFYTYCYHRFPVAPYLCFTGGKGSGKTTAVSVLKQLVFNPIPVSAASEAYIFRRLDKMGGCLLYDEAEDLTRAFKESTDLWKMLLSGTKPGSPVGRCVGDDHRTKAFHVFGPKALASIKMIPDTLLSRCISTEMLRCDTKSKKADGKPDAVEHQDFWQSLRDRLYRFWLDHGQALRVLPTAEQVSPPALQAREREVWLPLFQMAKILEGLGVGGRLLQSLQKYACDPDRVSDEATAEGLEEIEFQILRAFAELHPGGYEVTQAFPTPPEVLYRVQENNPGQYGILRQKTVAMTLSRYHIKTHRLNTKRVRHCTIEHLETLEQRYNVKLSGTPSEKPVESVTTDKPPQQNGFYHGKNKQIQPDRLSNGNPSPQSKSDGLENKHDRTSDGSEQITSPPKTPENKTETPAIVGSDTSDGFSKGVPTRDERRAALIAKEARRND